MSLSLKEIQLRLNVPQHVLIHLCEKEVVVPTVDTDGRGRFREFSAKNLFEFAVALELRKYEIPISIIRIITNILSSFEKSVKRSLTEFKLPDSISSCSPKLELYLFSGEFVVFTLGEKVIVGFDIKKLLEGNKAVRAQKLKSLPTHFDSYLRIDLSGV